MDILMMIKRLVICTNLLILTMTWTDLTSGQRLHDLGQICPGSQGMDILKREHNFLKKTVEDQANKLEKLEEKLNTINEKIEKLFVELNEETIPASTTQVLIPTTELMSTVNEEAITTKEQTQTIQISTTTQTGQSTDNRGKEFLILFMRNFRDNGSLSIAITTDKNASVSLLTSPSLNAGIKSAIDSRVHFTSHTQILFPFQMMCEYWTVEHKAVIVQSTAPLAVTLFQRNALKGSGDGTTIIPTNRLSTKYLISSTNPYKSSDSYYSQFAIAALYERTKINITLKMKEKIPVTIFGKNYTDGDIFQITLDRFETFQVNHTTDLTGTFITSTNSIAVFSGNRCQKFKIDYCSHLLTQLPPTLELDKEYIVPSFFNNSETLIQILSESQGSVNLSVGTSITNIPLIRKESRNIEVAQNKTTTILSMNPVLVTGFGMGSNNNDPFMTVIPGVNQYVNYYKFIIPDGFTTNFICVVIQRDAIDNLQINGITVNRYQTVYESLVYLNRFYIVRTFGVSNGTYLLTTTDESTFGVIVYGHDRIDGYAFSGDFVFP